MSRRQSRELPTQFFLLPKIKTKLTAATPEKTPPGDAWGSTPCPYPKVRLVILTTNGTSLRFLLPADLDGSPFTAINLWTQTQISWGPNCMGCVAIACVWAVKCKTYDIINPPADPKLCNSEKCRHFMMIYLSHAKNKFCDYVSQKKPFKYHPRWNKIHKEA